MDHKDFSILQHKDGSIKTREELSNDKRRYRAILVLGPLICAGILITEGFLYYKGLESSMVIASFKIAAKLPFYSILFLALAYYGLPEITSRIRELAPYTDEGRAIPTTEEQLLETTTLTKLEERITRTRRIALISTLMAVVYIAWDTLTESLINLIEAGTPALSGLDLIRLGVAFFGAFSLGYLHHLRSKRELVALETHYNTLRHRLEEDANQQGGLSISAQKTTAGALTSAGEQ